MTSPQSNRKMNLPVLETQIAQSVQNLNTDQQIDIMQYVNRLAEEGARKKENYRKKALREIRKALKTIWD